MLKVEGAKIYVVTNSSDGVKEEWLESFENLYKVEYSPCLYSSDEVVDRAMERLNENCYHCLFNNSHHFVTLAKTGRENPLTEIIESLTHQEVRFVQPCSKTFFQCRKQDKLSFIATHTAIKNLCLYNNTLLWFMVCSKSPIVTLTPCAHLQQGVE